MALAGSFALAAVPGEHGYLVQVGKFPLLSQEEEYELASEYRRTGNKQAAWALISSHLRQVVAIARGYRGYGLPEADLVQEGNIGLMRAVQKFDPERSVRLSTYATHWIKSAIGEYIIKNWRILKVASTTAQRKLFYRLRSITSKLGHRLTRADARQIAEDLEVKETDVLEMEKRMLLPEIPFENNNLADDELDLSPSATLEADGGDHAGLTVIDDEVEQVKHEALVKALAQLSERERQIVQARAMSGSGKDTKLRELATTLGISSERVRQLEKKALRKVKEYVLAACAHLVT